MSIDATTKAFRITGVEKPLEGPGSHDFVTQRGGPFGVIVIGRKVVVIVRKQFQLWPNMDVHLFDTVDLQWTCRDRPDRGPRGKQGRVYLVDDHIHVLMDVIGELWKYDVILNVWQWMNIKFRDEIVVAVTGHTVDYLERAKWMVVFGGFTDYSLSSTVTVLDIRSRLWIKPKVFGNPPQPRSKHSSCVVNDSIYIYGGMGDRGRIFADLHILRQSPEGMVWSTVQPKGYRRSPSCLSTLSCVGGKFLVLGGIDGLFRYVTTPCIYEPSTNLWLALARKAPASYTINAQTRQLNCSEHFAVLSPQQTLLIFAPSGYPRFQELSALVDE